MMTCSEDCHYFLSALPQEGHRLLGPVPWIPKGSTRDPQGTQSDLSPMEKARRLGVYQWIPIIWGIAMITIGL